MRRGILLAVAGACLVCVLAFGWLFYAMYWQQRSCFDENGRCFLPEGVVVSDNNFVWGLFAAMELALGLLFWLWSPYVAR